MNSDRPDPKGADRPIGGDPGLAHFATSHLRQDFAGRSARGAVVTMGAQGLKVLVQIVAIVLLARLLAPQDFGLFAMVVVVLSVLELVRDMGLSAATIQREDLTSRQVSTLFWLNVGLGAAATAVAASLGPLLAWIYDEPALTELTVVVAFAFVFTALAAQHLALLRRQMRFSAVAGVQVGAEVVALAAAVIAAAAGLGFWALVVQRLIWAAASAAGAWLACGWRPGRPGPFHEVRSMVVFGGNATASMAVGKIATNLDKLLIGWFWGFAILGLYERGQKLVQLPIRNLNVPLATVGLPMLSRLLHDPARYRRAYFGLSERLVMLIAPAGGLLVAAGGPVVELILGPQWQEAGPIIAWMGVAMLYMPLTYTLSWLYLSQDRSAEMLRAGFVNAGLSVAAVIAGLPFGAAGVAAAYALTGISIRAPALCWLAGRKGPVATRDLLAVLLTPGIALITAAVTIWLVRAELAVDDAPLWAAVGIYAVLAYLSATLVYFVVPRTRDALIDLLRLPALMLNRATGTA